MGCPRCNRVRIERDGETFRCAVCGMPYDPNLGTRSSVVKEAARLFSTARGLREAAVLRGDYRVLEIAAR